MALQGWDRLDSRKLNIAIAQAPKWDKLDSRKLSIEPMVIPPPEKEDEYKLVLSTIYPDGRTYNGPAQRWTSSFKFLPANWPGANWVITKKIDQSIAAKVTNQGLKPLTMKLYERGFDYILVIEATSPSAALDLPAVPALPAAAIVPLIVGATVILGLIIISVVILKTEDFLYKAPEKAAAAGLIFLAIAGVAVLGLAIWKGTSVKEAVIGRT